MARKLQQIDHNKVVEFLSTGYSVPEIADVMELGVRTLEARLVRMRDKCNARNNTHLVAKYLRDGLIE